MAEATYKVTLPFTFLADSRTRGGITIPRDGGYEGPLDADQLKAIKADDILTVEEIASAKAPTETKAPAK